MRKILLYTVCFFSFCIKGQSPFPGQRDFSWPDAFVNYQAVPDSLKSEDAVILKEQLDVTETFVKRRVAIKIQTAKGLSSFSKIELPENFDLTNYPNFSKQGRFKGRKDPLIYNYKIQYFSVRVIKPNKKIVDTELKPNSQKVIWVDFHGQHYYDYITDFQTKELEVGDIIEYMYKADVDWNGIQSVIYLNAIYPKLDYNLKIVAKFPSQFSNVKQLYHYGIPKDKIALTSEHKVGEEIDTYLYHYDFLRGLTYPDNAIVGVTLPNITLNHGAYKQFVSGGNMKTYTVYDRYVWMLSMDTTEKVKIYDKYHANLRKFIAKFPEDKTDSTGNIFFSQLIDTLNAMYFASAEGLNYGETSQYSLTSSEQLLKGRLAEEFIYKNYSDFLEERNVFFYNCTVIDRRYGMVNSDYRNHYMLERNLIVLPGKKGFKYYMPRYKGIKYLPDELPFYFEGTKCLLSPCYSCMRNTKKAQLLFLTTPKSSYNENVRTENASFRVICDSFKVRTNIKENISGQFSTILRHYYNKEFIDSMIPENYFKKCSDKPHSTNVKTKQISSQKLFPFKNSFNCSEEISMGSKNVVDLNEWFSFFWSKETFPVIPNHDYYIDFPYTDTYNYLFEFDKPTEISNLQSLNRKLNNEYFEVVSSMVKQDEGKYLLSVLIKVKQIIVPKADGAKLIEFANLLDEINNFKLELKN